MIDLLWMSLFTMAVEAAVAFLLGFKSRRAVLAVLLINLISSPLLYYFLWRSDLFLFIQTNPILYIFLVLLIALFEWLLLKVFLPKSKRKLFFPAVLMNVISFIAVKMVF